MKIFYFAFVIGYVPWLGYRRVNGIDGMEYQLSEHIFQPRHYRKDSNPMMRSNKLCHKMPTVCVRILNLDKVLILTGLPASMHESAIILQWEMIRYEYIILSIR